MRLMLVSDQPRDFVIATGETHSVREFAEIAFSYVGLDYADYVRVDGRFFRPAEIEPLVGDSSAALAALGWKPTYRFRDLIAEMVEADLALLSDPTRTFRPALPNANG
jgi:GDPmannose 4,6-dehydratase